MLLLEECNLLPKKIKHTDDEYEYKYKICIKYLSNRKYLNELFWFFPLVFSSGITKIAE